MQSSTEIPREQGSEPEDVTKDDLTALQRSLDDSISQVRSSVQGRQHEIEVGQVAQIAFEQPVQIYAAPRIPEYYDAREGFVPECWNTSNEASLTKTDGQNRTFHQIITGPYFLSKASDELLGYHRWTSPGTVPSFAGTGSF
jgi:hypothetical protein